jgi:pyrroline-5-carboxylate reductase
MAEAIIAGLLRKKLVGAEQIAGSHPRQSRREEMHVKYGVEMFESNRDTVTAVAPETPDASSIVVLAIKPQRLYSVLQELKGSLVKEQLVVSIVAGAKMEALAEELVHDRSAKA